MTDNRQVSNLPTWLYNVYGVHQEFHKNACMYIIYLFVYTIEYKAFNNVYLFSRN